MKHKQPINGVIGEIQIKTRLMLPVSPHSERQSSNFKNAGKDVDKRLLSVPPVGM